MNFLRRLHRLTESHPLTTACIVLLIYVGVFAAPVLIYGPIDITDATGRLPIEFLLQSLPGQAIVCLSLVLIVAFIGWLRACGLSSSLDRRGLKWSLWIGALPLLFVIMLAGSLLTNPPRENIGQIVTALLAFNLLVGLFEETLFRGVVFRGLFAHANARNAALISALAFGLFHLINLAAGQDVALTLFQVANAAALGVLFCGVTLQSGNLWPAIILHMLWNSYAMLGQLSLETLDMPGLDGPQYITPMNYLLPVFLTLLGLLCIKRWEQRKTPPSMPLSH